MRLSEKGIQTLNRQAKAIEHYEAALEAIFFINKEVGEHWNFINEEVWDHWDKARAILVGMEISESDAVHLGKSEEA
jgi:hypothetical protein